MKIAYPAKFARDGDGRILVTFRDFPEAGTDGADMDEAQHEAIDLLNSVLMFRMKYREDIPAPSKLRRGEKLVAPDADVALKIALYVSMRARNMSAAELRRRLAVDNREVQRIMDPHHATKTARMVEAIEAAGSRAVVELQSA